MDIEATLGNIGLTKNEIKIYISLLEIGTTTTGAIIKRTGIHTSKVYDGLERLATKGLVTHIIQSNVKYFKAVSPERLIQFLDEKEKAIESQKEQVKSIMSALHSKELIAENITQAEIYQGWKGLDTVYGMLRETLKRGEYNYVLGASKGEDQERVRIFFNKHLKILAEHKIKQKIIYNENTRGNIIEQYKHKNLFEVKYMENTTPSEINIWRDNVMIVILRNTPTAILIKDVKVSDSFKEYFNILWKSVKK